MKLNDGLRVVAFSGNQAYPRPPDNNGMVMWGVYVGPWRFMHAAFRGCSASVLHEFENQLGAQFFEPVGNVLIPITTSQVGTFGQYGVGIAASVPGTGTLGFVRFDGRVGENIRGWSLTGGARVSFNSP